MIFDVNVLTCEKAGSVSRDRRTNRLSFLSLNEVSPLLLNLLVRILQRARVSEDCILLLLVL